MSNANIAVDALVDKLLFIDLLCILILLPIASHFLNVINDFLLELQIRENNVKNSKMRTWINIWIISIIAVRGHFSFVFFGCCHSAYTSVN